MYPASLIYVVFGALCIVGAIVVLVSAIWFSRWLESQSQLPYYSQSIRSLDGERVYVELSALRQDEEGYFIPGYGRIRQTWDNTNADPLRQMPEVKAWKGKVALICYDRTKAASDVREYIIGNIVPL